MLERIQKRNADFIAAVRRIEVEARRSGRAITRMQAISEAINSPAPSFYLLREHVWKQLTHRRTHGAPACEQPHRTRMWNEIIAALQHRCASHPRETPWEALDWVLECHHPSGFFISPKYGKRLLHNIQHSELARARAEVPASPRLNRRPATRGTITSKLNL